MIVAGYRQLDKPAKQIEPALTAILSGSSEYVAIGKLDIYKTIAG